MLAETITGFIPILLLWMFLYIRFANPFALERTFQPQVITYFSAHLLGSLPLLRLLVKEPHESSNRQDLCFNNQLTTF